MRRAALNGSAARACRPPEVDAELLLGHVLGVSRGDGCRRSPCPADAAAGRRRTLSPELVDRRAAREPLQHLTGRRGRSAPSSSRSGPASSCRDPRPSRSPRSPSTRCAPIPAAGADRRRPRHGQRRDRARPRRRGAARARDRRRELPRGVPLDPREPRRTGLANAAPRLRRPRRCAARARRPGLRRRVNPPYIPAGAIPRDPEVRLHDPAAALYGGEDGLDVIRVVSRTALACCAPAAPSCSSTASCRAPSARPARRRRLARRRNVPDLSGRPRATSALRP